MSALLGDDFLRRLDAYALAMRQMARGGSGGLRKSRALGTSVEFSDFREYAPGDDPRRVDWNAYARFDRLFLKLFMEEQETCVRILLDTSASMRFDAAKWRLSLQLAAMIGYLALSRYDRAALATLSESNAEQSRAFHGRQSYPALVHALESAPEGGKTRLSQSVRTLRTGAERGVCVLISDLFSLDGHEEALKYLQYQKQEVSVLHILSEAETRPELTGRVRLLDAEGEPPRDLDVTPDALEAYARALSDFEGENRAFCHARGIPYIRLDADIDFERDALRAMAQGGLLA